MSRHPDLNDDLQSQSLRALPDPAGRKIIKIERNDVYRIETQLFRFVQKRQIALGKGFAELSEYRISWG
jgi:hypothetical protein